MPSVDADGMSFNRKAYVEVATLLMQRYIQFLTIPRKIENICKNFEIKINFHIFAYIYIKKLVRNGFFFANGKEGFSKTFISPPYLN